MVISMIWIRVDANKEIGSGHVMRCLSIAEALQKRGREVFFLLADEGAIGLLKTRNMNYHILDSEYDQLETELEQLRAMIVQQKPELLLIDSYFVTDDYLRTLQELVTLAYLDDIPKFNYPVDVIINYNIYGQVMAYDEQPTLKPRTLLLGPSYAPLREQFQQVEYEVRAVATDVLLTTGGSDKYNLAGKILERVLVEKETENLHYHVVSGVFNPYRRFLEQLAKKYSNVHLYHNVTDMAKLMKRCDIAISAGGSTMYELCAVGVPCLCFSFVDNQELIVESFGKQEMVAYSGDYLKEQEQFFEEIQKALSMLAKKKELRREYSSKARRMIDGWGAQRLAEALEEIGGQHVNQQ